MRVGVQNKLSTVVQGIVEHKASFLAQRRSRVACQSHIHRNRKIIIVLKEVRTCSCIGGEVPLVPVGEATPADVLLSKRDERGNRGIGGYGGDRSERGTRHIIVYARIDDGRIDRADLGIGTAGDGEAKAAECRNAWATL